MFAFNGCFGEELSLKEQQEELRKKYYSEMKVLEKKIKIEYKKSPEYKKILDRRNKLLDKHQ